MKWGCLPTLWPAFKSSPRSVFVWLSVCLQCGRPRFDPWVGKILWRRKWQPTPVFLPGKSHGWSLVGYSPWGRKESGTTEWLHFTSLQRLTTVQGDSSVAQTVKNQEDSGSGRSSGEGNGNLLQYSCLENSMGRGAWWVPVHGVTKSWT